MSQWDQMAATAVSMVQGFFGQTATFTAWPLTGSSKSITVTPTMTPPQVIIGDETGQTSDRWVYLLVNQADVPSPQRGDTYVLTAAGYAGTWSAARVERSSPARWLIACRLRTHDNIAGPNATQVKA